MSVVNNFVEQVRGYSISSLDRLRKRFLGVNNERLDLLIDTFYKLTPPQRNLTLTALGSAFGIFLFAGVGLYFAQLRVLSIELNKRFDALHDLRALRMEYQQEQARFEKMSQLIETKTTTLKMKPFFEKIANSQGVTIEGLTEQRLPLAGENPLSQTFQEVKVEMNLRNISIPRLLNFLVEVEKSGNYVRVDDMQIRARYGTKMYFDVQLKARGFSRLNQ